MAIIEFYEKPGCVNNTRQKKLLEASGHIVNAHSILATEWTRESLRPYFGDKPVAEWFNRSAPRVKNGEIAPEDFNEMDALSLMVLDHLFIKRPLMESGGVYCSGFDPEKIDAWLGLEPVDGREEESREILGHDLQHCPKMVEATQCDSPMA